jgi:hypothetical protein
LDISGKERNFRIKEIVTFVNKLTTLMENNGDIRMPLSEKEIHAILINLEKTIPKKAPMD